MTASIRLAGFLAAALGLCLPQGAVACSPLPPPEPPPRAAMESESDFAARRDKWYADQFEAERQASLPGRSVREDRLWAMARRVALARLEKIGSVRLRGSEGQLYKSPLATLRTIRWLKGPPSPRRLKVRYLSDSTCDHVPATRPRARWAKSSCSSTAPARSSPAMSSILSAWTGW